MVHPVPSSSPAMSCQDVLRWFLRQPRDAFSGSQRGVCHQMWIVRGCAHSQDCAQGCRWGSELDPQWSGSTWLMGTVYPRPCVLLTPGVTSLLTAMASLLLESELLNLESVPSRDSYLASMAYWAWSNEKDLTCHGGVGSPVDKLPNKYMHTHIHRGYLLHRKCYMWLGKVTWGNDMSFGT